MNIREFLDHIEEELPKYLNPAQLVLDWQSALIDFRKPVVERLWKQWGQWRVCLDSILPCLPGEVPEYHRHHNPTAMHILSSTKAVPQEWVMPVTIAPTILDDFGIKDIVSSDRTYKFSEHQKHPDERVFVVKSKHVCHSLIPLERPIMVLMVTNQPWNAKPSKTDKLAKPLSPNSAREIGKFFSERFGVVFENEMDPMGG